MQRLLKSSTALISAAALLNMSCIVPVLAVTPAAPTEPVATLATSTGTAGAAQVNPNPGNGISASTAAKIALLRQRVKHVFVIFQENRSFDHYFGTYPGANGLYATYPGANPSDQYAQPATSFSSFNSVIRNVDGSYSTINPFLIPRTIVNQAGATVQLYPEDLLSVDHSHAGYINDMHADAATKTISQNDGYALDQEGLHYATDASGTAAAIYNGSNVAPTSNPNLQTKQKGEVVMGHIDCDTIPFMWQWADRFALLDNMHQTATGPSTPNAIAMIAGQVGDTQWVKHPANANGTGTPYAGALTVPNITDSAPFPGSSADTAAVKPPFGPDESSGAGGSTIGTPAKPQVPLTFASLPLSFLGSQIGTVIRSDEHPATDLVDVQHDIQAIAARNPVVDWGWYQQGYGPEPFDGSTIHEGAGSGTFNSVEHASYIVHHNGPQYFGYIGDNSVLVGTAATGTSTPSTAANGKMHGLQQFFTDIAANNLNAQGGVYYIRGGYYNNNNLKPIDPNPNIQNTSPGNDDHANYSDSQISEAMAADAVNAIASSQYWADSAIIVTYDESDGFYDHQPQQFRSWGPDGQPETGGPRIPLIVISPYAAAHTVSHVYSEHSSVIKFIDEVFGLTPLGELPDEVAARAAGAANPAFNAPNGSPQTNLGPADALATMGDLLEAFDMDRLSGNIAPLPASYAMITTSNGASIDTQASLPHYGGAGCNALGIVPTDYVGQTPGAIVAGSEAYPPPLDFNPRPTNSPGSPYYNTSNNTTAGSATGTGGAWPN
ncbi:MAG: alkaline phosphatase family protein [Xanthobacteraceae bacterium]|nr:alkaline phosphatase family protein [Xanthobacteraceae bacterium]